MPAGKKSGSAPAKTPGRSPCGCSPFRICVLGCCGCTFAIISACACLVVPILFYQFAPISLPSFGPTLMTIRNVVPSMLGIKFGYEDFYNLNNTLGVLPLAPSTYPEAFHGILWMDQHGAYGHSELPSGAPDLALSFGDAPFTTWDPKTRRLILDVSGPAWTWYNSPDGYFFYWAARLLSYQYIFELREDEQQMQVYPTFDLGRLGRYSIPKTMLSFTMEKITPAAGACPPTKDTPKKEVSKCATWDRVTTVLPTLFGDRFVKHYFVYQIADVKGNPIQPAFDSYLEHAVHSCEPNRFAATLFAFTLGEKGRKCPTALRGPRKNPDSTLYGSTAGKTKDEL